MRRAQERVQQARPYSEQIRTLVSRLANAGGEDVGEGVALLKERPVRTIGFIVITPDRGLCGALPGNINRKAMSTAIEERNKFSEQGRQVPGTDFIAVGRKGRDFIVRTQQTLLAEFVNYGDRPTIGDASAIAQVAVNSFLKKRSMSSFWFIRASSTQSRSSQSPYNYCLYSRLLTRTTINART